MLGPFKSVIARFYCTSDLKMIRKMASMKTASHDNEDGGGDDEVLV